MKLIEWPKESQGNFLNFQHREKRGTEARRESAILTGDKASALVISPEQRFFRLLFAQAPCKGSEWRAPLDSSFRGMELIEWPKESLVPYSVFQHRETEAQRNTEVFRRWLRRFQRCQIYSPAAGWHRTSPPCFVVNLPNFQHRETEALRHGVYDVVYGCKN